MKTLILGYKDEAGRTSPEVVCLPSVAPAEQYRLFGEAKREHKFPKHIVRLELCVIQDDPDVAISLGDHVAKGIASVNEAFEKAQADRLKSQEAALATSKTLGAAEKKVHDAALERNKLMGELHVAEVKLRNAKLANSQIPSDAHKASVDEAEKALIGDPKKKVASLKDQIEDAKAAYEKAAKELEDLKHPKKK